MPERFVVGVDLGGTNVRACCYTEDGTEAGPKFSNPSRAQEGTAAILDAITKTVCEAAESCPVVPSYVGMAVPGHIDNDAGTVVWAPNFGEEVNGVFENWTNVQLRRPLFDRLKLPIVLGNDANLAAMGEYRYGSGRNEANCLVLITLGTGVGGGVVMAPRSVFGRASGPLVLLGGNQGGAELGHICIVPNGNDCNAGTYGPIEAYCQRDAIIARAVNRLRRGRSSIINDMVGGDLSQVTPKIISDAAAKDDELAIQVWSEVGYFLGISIGNFVNIFAPDVLAVGGQIAKAGEFLLGPARRIARDIAIPSLFQDVNIVLAEQVEDAGMLGGAALAFEALEWMNPEK